MTALLEDVRISVDVADALDPEPGHDCTAQIALVAEFTGVRLGWRPMGVIHKSLTQHKLIGAATWVFNEDTWIYNTVDFTCPHVDGVQRCELSSHAIPKPILMKKDDSWTVTFVLNDSV